MGLHAALAQAPYGATQCASVVITADDVAYIARDEGDFIFNALAFAVTAIAVVTRISVTTMVRLITLLLRRSADPIAAVRS